MKLTHLWVGWHVQDGFHAVLDHGTPHASEGIGTWACPDGTVVVHGGLVAHDGDWRLGWDGLFIRVWSWGT